ncbi:MAG: nucleotidyltransferase domain-containing protein [Candidatus Liptonbacteria bacterium]|nr:nucleotidyltransferase domain-containing protein [Candidatus Liptonbacteria bacterium]
MPRLESLGEPDPEKGKQIRESLKNADVKPRLAFVWPLSKLHSEAFLALKEGAISDDLRSRLGSSQDKVDKIILDKIVKVIWRIQLAENGEKDHKETPPLISTKKLPHNEQQGENGEKHREAPPLLSTKKSLFAALKPEELAENLKCVETIVDELKSKYGDGFVGITVFGSTAKGYWEKRSDIDFMVIADKREIFKDFESRLEQAEIFPCPSCVYSLDLEEKQEKKSAVVKAMEMIKKALKVSMFGFMSHRKDRPHRASFDSLHGQMRLGELQAFANLFHGIFMGDSKALLEIQKLVLDRVGKDAWDRIRAVILDMETSLGKAEFRLGLSVLDLNRVEAAAAILRTPPPYQETLNILNRRVERLEKKRQAKGVQKNAA